MKSYAGKRSVVGRFVVYFLPLLLVFPTEKMHGRDELYVLNIKPPSVSVIDSERLEISHTIPLDGPPSFAVVGPGENSLYVLLNGVLTLNSSKKQEKEPSRLALIDLSTREVAKKVSVGWNAGAVALSDDGKYVVCFAHGLKATDRYKGIPSKLTVIDTHTQEVASRFSNGFYWWDVLFNRDLSRIFVLGRHREGGPKQEYDEGKPYLLAFDVGQTDPILEIELNNGGKEMILSRDQSLLYVLDYGRDLPSRKGFRGQLHVIDVSSLRKLVTLDVGTRIWDMVYDEARDRVAVIADASPRNRNGKLFQIQGQEIVRVDEVCKEPQFIQRFGHWPGLFVWGPHEVSYIPDAGPARTSYVGLSKMSRSSAVLSTVGKVVGYPRVSRSNAASLTGAKVVGYPRETLYLPDSERVAFSVWERERDYRGIEAPWTKRGAVDLPRGRVGVVSLKGKALERVLDSGRWAGVMFAIRQASQTAQEDDLYGGRPYPDVFSSFVYHYAYGSISYAAQINEILSLNVSLAADPAERYLYVLNRLSNDITIFETSGGSLIKYVPLKASPGMALPTPIGEIPLRTPTDSSILRTPNGRYVTAYSGKEIVFIDTETNMEKNRYRVAKGAIEGIYVLKSKPLLVGLASKSLLVWDTTTAELQAIIDIPDSPRLLIEAN